MDHSDGSFTSKTSLQNILKDGRRPQRKEKKRIHNCVERTTFEVRDILLAMDITSSFEGVLAADSTFLCITRKKLTVVKH